MSDLAVTVMAGRYDANQNAVRSAFARETNAGADLIFTTEQSLKIRTEALKQPGYGLGRVGVAGRQAEQVVLYKAADWAPTGSPRSLELTTGGGHFSQRFPIYTTEQMLRQADGRMLAAIAVHMPSHLDKASRYFFPVNLVLWKRALAVLAHEVAVLRRQHPGIAILIGGDWNARQTSGWTGKALQHALPGFRAGEGDMFGNVWSLGLRPVGQPVSVPARGSSDHTIHRFVYAWNAPPKEN